ncbi:MAG: aminotransferase class V-fold PLP-dependent enzyme [Ktedonobacteraceae bacterium]
MSDNTTVSSLPSLDDMLQSLLLIEEGEHEFSGEEEDIQELRQLFFPITRNCVYLNHAANGPLPSPVVRSLYTYIEDTSHFGNVHFARWTEHERGAHRRMANMIHVQPDQVAMTASTGDGLMMIAGGLRWQPSDMIVSAECEFPSNVYPWLNLQEQGVQVQLVKMRENRVAVEDVLASITERTRLVSLSLVEFSTGYRNDTATIARYCHERGIICGIDAAQALGALDIDVQALGVDYLAAASHKWLLSPQTTGILYVADELQAQLQTARKGWFSVEAPHDFFNYEQPLKAGMARFEHSSPNALPIIALDAALGIFECIDGGMTAVEERILGLTGHAIAGLERLGYSVVSPQGNGERSGIVCFKLHPERQDISPQQFVDELASRNIHVAARGDVVRISPHFYNTLEEIDVLLNVLEDMRKPTTV